MQSLERVGEAEADGILAAFPVDAEGIGLHCQWHFDRNGPLRDVIHAMKYDNRPWYGQFLGRVLATSIRVRTERAVVLPLPLHRLRLLERGYNQAEWIASGLARKTGLTLRSGLLTRVRSTGTQTALSRDDRWRNVRGAFAASQSTGAGFDHALLVDDVVTTGATALSAALELRSSGIRRVTIVSLGLARG